MSPQPPRAREHYWDALRAGLMLLGIPYHVALSYRPGEQWIVRSGEGWAPFTWLAELIHVFRMPAFFIIAGYFAALLLARRAPGKWFKGRFVRLGVPFAAAIVTLVPIMNLACEFSNLPYSEALSSFVWNSTHSGGYWVRHLWFIIVLLYLSSAAAALVAALPRWAKASVPERIDRLCADNFLTALLAAALLIGIWEAVAVELFYIGGLATQLPQQILRIDELIIYAPWFALGCLLQRMPRTIARVGRFSWPIAGIAAIGLLLSFTIVDALHPAPGRALVTFAALAISQLLIAGARTLLDRPSALMGRLTDASYVIYLLHLPVITILVWLGQGIAMPAALKGLLVMLLATAISYVGWLAIARSGVLAFLYNGTTRAGALKAAPVPSGRAEPLPG